MQESTNWQSCECTQGNKFPLIVVRVFNVEHIEHWPCARGVPLLARCLLSAVREEENAISRTVEASEFDEARISEAAATPLGAALEALLLIREPQQVHSAVGERHDYKLVPIAREKGGSHQRAGQLERCRERLRGAVGHGIRARDLEQRLLPGGRHDDAAARALSDRCHFAPVELFRQLELLARLKFPNYFSITAAKNASG